MKSRPLRSNVIVRITEQAESKSAGGIVIVQTAQKVGPQKGQVLSIGPDVTEVSEGDFVLMNPHAQTTQLELIAGEKTVIISEEDILAVAE